LKSRRRRTKMATGGAGQTLQQTCDAAAKRAILYRCRRSDTVANWPAKLTAETLSAKKDKFELMLQ
jgi:hypothetical protein